MRVFDCAKTVAEAASEATTTTALIKDFMIETSSSN
jgi:hypothetical protein